MCSFPLRSERLTDTRWHSLSRGVCLSCRAMLPVSGFMYAACRSTAAVSTAVCTTSKYVIAEADTFVFVLYGTWMMRGT